MAQLWQQPFFQLALPIMVTIILATWYQNNQFTNIGKRIDDMGKRIDDLRSDMNAHFARIETRMDKLETKIEALQERSWR